MENKYYKEVMFSDEHPVNAGDYTGFLETEPCVIWYAKRLQRWYFRAADDNETRLASHFPDLIWLKPCTLEEILEENK